MENQETVDTAEGFERDQVRVQGQNARRRGSGRPRRKRRDPRRKYENRKSTNKTEKNKSTIPCEQWFITISNIQVSNYDPRERLLSVFPTNYLEQYAISMEENSEGSKSTQHLHALIIFKAGNGKSFDNLNELIGFFYPRPTYRYNIENVKSLDKSLKYISKSDKSLITNFSTSKFSQWYQLVQYCKSNEILNYTNPLIFGIKNTLTYVQQFHAEVRGNLVPWKGFESCNITDLITSCPWVDDVVNTYNINIKCFDKKPKHVYLYGKANCGKSTVVESIIGEDNLKHHTLFINSYSSPFFFQNFIQGVHHYIVLEEFQYEHCLPGNINFLKKALERNSCLSVPKKCQKEDIVKLFCPIFIISNFSLPGYADAAFKTRLNIIHATCPYYECPTHVLPAQLQEIKLLSNMEKQKKIAEEYNHYVQRHTNNDYTESSPEFDILENEIRNKIFPPIELENNNNNNHLLVPRENLIFDCINEDDERVVTDEERDGNEINIEEIANNEHT